MIGAQVLLSDLDEPFLEAALKSVGWCDYFVIVETAPDTEGSARNMAIVRSVVPEKKLLTSTMPEPGLDFAAARNKGLEWVPDGDFVMILDGDEVHFPEWRDICGYYLANGADSITAAFHHFVCYRDAVQAVYPREIVFRKYPDTQFVGKVHEQLHTTRRNPVVADYRYLHFSYLRPQPNVFERWRRYSEIEGEPEHYAGQNPEHIIDDRVSVATRFTLDYPPAVADLIEDYPVCPVALQGESEPEPPKVGLVLLTMPGDEEQVEAMLATLKQTGGEFRIYRLNAPGPTLSLTESLNRMFREALADGCEYVGWIHPDMRFNDPEWLKGLLHELRCWPTVGKVCAANTRDTIPETMIDGHEQAYLVRASVLREIGLFDEGFVEIGGREDWDFNRRVLNAGYRVVITPRSQVFHQGMSTRSRRTGPDTAGIRNAEYYFGKWGTYDPPV